MAPVPFLNITTLKASRLQRDGEDSVDDTAESKSNSNGSNSKPTNFAFPCCFVEDNDPRVRYEGAWTLDGSQFSTQHITTDAGSTVSFRFTGAGIAVFGMIPISNSTFRPPTALYYLDGIQMPETTLPFATTSIPNQPLFSTTSVLEEREHTFEINVTNAPTAYTIQRFFVPANFTTAKDMIGQIPSTNGTLTGNSASPTSITASTTSARTKATTSASWQMISSTPSLTTDAPNLQQTVRILAGLLGTLIFLLVVAMIAFCFLKRWSFKSVVSTSQNKDANQRETMFSSWLTSTASILRHESSIFHSPPRTPRSFYSRQNESRRGRSPSVGRTDSTMDGHQAPPLPPKPGILLLTP